MLNWARSTAVAAALAAGAPAPAQAPLPEPTGRPMEIDFSADPVLRLQVQFDGIEQVLDESAPSEVGRWLFELDGDRLVGAERDRRSRWTALTSE